MSLTHMLNKKPLKMMEKLDERLDVQAAIDFLTAQQVFRDKKENEDFSVRLSVPKYKLEASGKNEVEAMANLIKKTLLLFR